MVTASGAVTAADTGSNSGAAQTVSPGDITNKETFLQLLVAQIKNQNPLNPADGVEFVSQLAQFSELEQMMGIRQDVQALRQDAEGTQAGSSEK